MFGYEPERPDVEPGSWGEILTLLRIVLIELARPLAAIIGVMALIITTLILFFSHPPFALLPLSALVGLGWYVVRRDQQAIHRAEDALPRRYR
ncbi:MAG: hypothetical protein WC273_10345 [Dehalococcoidia bacterium]